MEEPRNHLHKSMAPAPPPPNWMQKDSQFRPQPTMLYPRPKGKQTVRTNRHQHLSSTSHSKLFKKRMQMPRLPYLVLQTHSALSTSLRRHEKLALCEDAETSGIRCTSQGPK